MSAVFKTDKNMVAYSKITCDIMGFPQSLTGSQHAERPILKPYRATFDDDPYSRAEGVAEGASRNIQEGFNLPNLSSSLCSHCLSHC